ncbi:MAG: hypothetical protein DHS20C17_12920 [Cyclobacteriaceae bacterium]|nr:MAG: hypothetical protein DHS20C17_12920 [Cyclobacteriaceae bacterium]
MIRTTIVVLFLTLNTFQGIQSQSVQPVVLDLPFVLFTDPQQLDEGGADRSLLVQIKKLVDATAAGEEITVCVFKFEQDELAHHLIQAQNRGVKVRVILNKGDTSKDTNKEMKDLLSSQLLDFHYIENKISKKGIIHNKFILFSEVETQQGPLKHLVLQTSSNFQKKGAKKLQDMLIFSSTELYYCYLDFWHQIKVLGTTDQLEHYQYFSCSDQKNNQAYYLPKRREKESFGKDPVLKVLEDIEQPSQTEIRFAHGKWDENREELAQALEKLQRQGALVEVVTNSDVDKDIRKELKELDKHVYYLDDDYNMHTKFFLVRQGDRKQVWTGSHNLTNRSLRENFEVLLKIEDPAIYQRYLDYFNQIKAVTLP